MNMMIRSAFAALILASTGVACAQSRYDVSAAVRNVYVQGEDVVAEIDLVILDEHGRRVPGFQSTPETDNPRSIEVKAYLCRLDGVCRFEEMRTSIGRIDGIDAYGIRAFIPSNSTPYPGLYLVQGQTREFWIGVRERRRDLSRVGAPPSVVLVAQGSTIVSASGR